MKLRELPEKTNLGGIKVKTPDGKIGYWVSQWARGVWLGNNKDGNGQIFPQFVDNLTDVLDWDVAEESEEVNL